MPLRKAHRIAERGGTGQPLRSTQVAVEGGEGCWVCSLGAGKVHSGKIIQCCRTYLQGDWGPPSAARGLAQSALQTTLATASSNRSCNHRPSRSAPANLGPFDHAARCTPRTPPESSFYLVHNGRPRWWKQKQGPAASNQLHLQAPPDARNRADLAVRADRHAHRGQDSRKQLHVLGNTRRNLTQRRASTNS